MTPADTVEIVENTFVPVSRMPTLSAASTWFVRGAKNTLVPDTAAPSNLRL